MSVSTPQKWDEYEKSAGRSSQPIIGLVGPDLLHPISILIIFDDMKYLATSMSGALDLCFKIFHVFNFRYLKDSINVWQFINQWFYGIPTAKAKGKKQTEHLSDAVLVNELEKTKKKRDTSQ